jgi:2-polyprenyl-3-methyl-5-hydroxy-6-metoxy-1,4-benzoquinol methylase
MDNRILKKYHVTNGNLISSIYFNFNYFIVSNIVNFKNKEILDFGGGLGFLKKKILQKGGRVKIYDIVKELTEIKNYKKFKFDIVIFCHVLYLIKEKDIRKIFRHFHKFKNITIITCFSNQTIINKIFAYLLGHPMPHEGTKTSPQKEQHLFQKFFYIEKYLNFFLFKVLVGKFKN